jgi:Sec-independent protein translocase protein TatA
MAILGGAALLLFGPEQLPKIARRVGGVVRDVQNTSQSFIREMERAADLTEERERAERAASAGLAGLPEFPPAEPPAPEFIPSPPPVAFHDGPSESAFPRRIPPAVAPALAAEPVQESLLQSEPEQPTMFETPKG